MDDSPSILGTGSVTVLSGQAGKVLYKVWGGKSGDSFGVIVSSLGDLDGDGYGDLVVGAQQVSGGPGYAKVLSGKTGKELHHVAGDGSGDSFGWAVTALGDIDGDRVPDFAVGAPQPGAILPSGAGYVRLFSGKSGNALATIRPRAGEKRFGGRVANGGDLDQDGVPDVVVVSDPATTGGPGLYLYSTRDVGLAAEPWHLPLSTAGTQTMTLDAGTAHAGRMYWVLGSVTGTRVGVPLPIANGILRLPLDYDPYTELTIVAPNSSILPNSRGLLDASGRATVQFKVPSGLPRLPAFTLHHAFLVFDSGGNWVYASNPAWLRLE